MSNSIWGDFAREAQVGGSGEFPDIPDDLYEATIIEVSEPVDQANPFDPEKMQTRFHVVWRIEDLEEKPTIWDFLNLPDQYIEQGYVHEKSGLYKMMTALGYDMNGTFGVNPPEWVGKRARITVKNQPNAKGDVRPKVTDRMAVRQRQAPTERRQPVGAGAGRGLRARMEADTEDD